MELKIGQFIAPVIVLAIKSFFFSRANNYSLGQKLHISHFFFFFYEKMIRVVCAMFAVAIEHLKMRLDNSYLSLGKNAIWFKPSAQKEETDKQTASILYY